MITQTILPRIAKTLAPSRHEQESITRGSRKPLASKSGSSNCGLPEEASSDWLETTAILSTWESGLAEVARALGDLERNNRGG